MRTRSISLKSRVCRLKTAVCALSSVIRSPISDRRPLTADRGFTLIELLVAMAILMVIVLMLSNVFQQSTRAWDTGMQQAEVGLEARAAINLIQQDLSQAVASTNWPFTPMEFYMLTRSSTNDAAIEQVRYSFGSHILSRNNAEIVRGVDSFNMVRLDSGGTDELPDLVEIKMVLTSQRDFSNVRIYVQDRGYDESEISPGDVIDTHHDN